MQLVESSSSIVDGDFRDISTLQGMDPILGFRISFFMILCNLHENKFQVNKLSDWIICQCAQFSANQSLFFRANYTESKQKRIRNLCRRQTLRRRRRRRRRFRINTYKLYCASESRNLFSSGKTNYRSLNQNKTFE